VKRPRISQRVSWARKQDEIARLIVAGLLRLRRNADLIKDENDLNRKLFNHLEDLNYEMGGGCLAHYEARNQPHADDAERAAREDKTPDIQWSWEDHAADNRQSYRRSFILECKRLGTPTSASWILNHNYVLNGILRFIVDTHGYAKGESVAAMVGYIESMDLATILDEVNTVAKSKALTEMTATATEWEAGLLRLLDQELDRSFPGTPLRLRHYWLDLRDTIKNPPPRCTNTSDRKGRTRKKSSGMAVPTP